MMRTNYQDGGVNLPNGPLGDSLKTLLHRQLFAESSFRPNAKSPAGASGVAQIMPSVVTDYKKATGNSNVDVTDPKQAVQVQMWYLNNIANKDFINKPNQTPQVHLAKTLAAYNWGSNNLLQYLTKQKQSGIDIYNSMDWLNGLPTETQDYIGKILLGNNPEFEKQYRAASQTNPRSNYYQDGGMIKKSRRGVAYNQDGGKYGFKEDLWGQKIKDFASMKGYKYDTYKDFLQNALFQDDFLQYNLDNLS